MTATLAHLRELTRHFGEPMTATLADLRKLTRHFAPFAEPMTATLADLRKLTRPLSAFAAFQGHFLSAEREVAFDDLRSTVSAEEMDKEENDRNDKEKLNQRGSHMEDNECPNPLRNTNLIRFASELHGITQQSGGVDSQGHIPRSGVVSMGRRNTRPNLYLQVFQRPNSFVSAD